MTPLKIIVVLFALTMIFKGLAVLLETKKLERWIDDIYTEKSYLKWFAFVAGVITLFVAVDGMPILNILALLFGFVMIFNGILLEYPKEMKTISKKTLESTGIKIMSGIAVLAGLVILYIAII